MIILCPYHGPAVPALVQVSESKDHFVVLFTQDEDTPELHERIKNTMARLLVTRFECKQVIDMPAFMDSVLDENVRVMCNPIFLSDGRVRWIELLADDLTESQKLSKFMRDESRALESK